MRILFVALGFLPFAFGGLINWAAMTHPDHIPSYPLIGILFLLLWAAISFLIKLRRKSSKEVVLSFNLIAFIVLLLIGIQELILHAYWSNLVGIWTQLFYLPLLNIGFTLTRWSSSVFSAYCAAFVLMLLASALGCSLRKPKLR